MEVIFQFPFFIKRYKYNMKVDINNNTIDIKFSFRADIIFENITNKTFEGKKETDWITYFYSNVVCKDNSISFDSFIDWLDDNPNELMNFINAYMEHNKNMSVLTRKADEVDKTPINQD